MKGDNPDAFSQLTDRESSEEKLSLLVIDPFTSRTGTLVLHLTLGVHFDFRVHGGVLKHFTPKCDPKVVS